MDDEHIEGLRAALAAGLTIIFCPYGEVREVERVMSVGTYGGNQKTGDDPEPGPVAWLADGKYVALFNSAGPEEWVVCRPLFPVS